MKMELAETGHRANITIIEQGFRRCLSRYCTYSPAGENRWNDERLLLFDPEWR